MFLYRTIIFDLLFFQNDTLVIYDGVNNQSNVLFDKTMETINITSSSANVIFIHLLSDNTDNSLPIMIHYHPFCEEWIDLSTNSLKSPNHPSPYDNNVTCIWEITASFDKYIALNFLTFDVNMLYM